MPYIVNLLYTGVTSTIVYSIIFGDHKDFFYLRYFVSVLLLTM